MEFLRGCVRIHEDESNKYDEGNWRQVSELKSLIGREENDRASLLMQARVAIENGDYTELSRLELIIEEKLEELRTVYDKYIRNML